jgi:hypothetical protein
VAPISNFGLIEHGTAETNQKMHIGSQDTGISALQVVMGAEGRAEEIVKAYRSGWVSAAELDCAVVHRSLSGDSIVELSRWRGVSEHAADYLGKAGNRLRSIFAQVAVTSHILELVGVRPGRESRRDGFALDIQTSSTQPELIALFHPRHRSRAQLLQYLHDASLRLAEQVDGWIGAALYLETSTDMVVEYLQFQDLEAAAASQDLPIVQAHQRELRKFGDVTAKLYFVSEIYQRPDVE